jgi:hypothetical protein
LLCRPTLNKREVKNIAANNEQSSSQTAIVVSTYTNYMPRIGGSKAHMKASKPAAETISLSVVSK